MTRRLLAALAAVSLAMPIAPMAYAQDITVTAPRHGKRDPATGAPIETVTHSVTVSTAGLDLATDSGLRTAEGRVRQAAVGACRWLDQHYTTVADSRNCVKEATDDAMARARAAPVAQAQ